MLPRERVSIKIPEKPMPRTWIVAAFALPLLWGPAAFAQEGNPGDGGHRWHNRGEWQQQRCTDRYARKAAHLAYLEAKLALTDAQRPAWTKWRQTQLDAADQRKSSCLQHQEKKEGEKPTVIEREARAEKWLSARLAQLQASKPALQALYDTLTPEQKAEFDRSAHHGHHGWHHHGQREEGHQGWHGGQQERL